ncbi:MAG: sulfur carrier protein ThiS [Bacteroidaceae bacterium]|nr:sulfur carrier protein ThiS [Bacteroidaceae bacterium]
MKILINDKNTETASANLHELAAELKLADKGVAIALNGVMVQRDSWKSALLNESDKVIIIKAVCGG